MKAASPAAGELAGTGFAGEGCEGRLAEGRSGNPISQYFLRVPPLTCHNFLLIYLRNRCF